MTLDKTLINRIYRQYTLAENEFEDFQKYDDIVAMKYGGICLLYTSDAADEAYDV